MIDRNQLLDAYSTARNDLIAESHSTGHWIGELSSSALSTAVAVSAMSMVDGERFRQLIDAGLLWLSRSVNADGGWGDTDKSRSNISTTMLVRAAFHLADAVDRNVELMGRAEQYIDSHGGVHGLRRRYGTDKTFAVPILTNYALAGLTSWREVSALPFELACLPHSVLGMFKLPVVSYAIPALVAIGQARFHHRKPINPIVRLVRRCAIGRSLRVLAEKQPANGGFLEAAPLTGFVVMSLTSIGLVDHPVVRRGIEFIADSVRDDGSWPIDTNLATWTTSSAIQALASGSNNVGQVDCLDWLLSCQHQEVHPFTQSAAGGWGWTDLSGAVPDVDDTSGALLALAAMLRSKPDRHADRILRSAKSGIAWLLDLQNSNGGWPTFCRGWSNLPFDRSGADLTAHSLRALNVWRKLAFETLDSKTHKRIETALDRGLRYLSKSQRDDGSWIPLWFGNQHLPDEENSIYGTARVLTAYHDLDLIHSSSARRALSWLVDNRNSDGGWGGDCRSGSSVEETALAIEALILGKKNNSLQVAIDEGLKWLIGAIADGRHRESSPIGFYFAKLWYYERLYPLIFTVSALGRAVGRYPPEV